MNPTLLYLADLRYRLHQTEGGNVHIQAMQKAFSEFLPVREPSCRLALAIVRRASRQGRPQGALKLLEALGLAVSVLEKGLSHLRQRPALVYARHEIPEVPAVLLLKTLGAHVALEVNAFITQERAAVAAPNARARRWAEMLAFRLADTLYCVSGHLRDQLIAAGIPAEKIHVTHNGIHAEDFPAVPPPNPADTLTIGFVGMNHAWHQLPVLVGAFADVRHRHPRLRLKVVGPSSPELEQAIAKHGLTEQVEVTGYVPRGQALVQLASFDVAVVPTAAPYGSPLKLFEYMALGRAIVAARTPAMTEVLSEGETGLFFEPGDRASLAAAFARLIGDPALSARLGPAAREAVLSSFTWRHNALAVLGRAAPGCLPLAAASGPA